MTRNHLLAAAAVLIIACWNSFGFHQGDEHFQILDFAAAKLGLINTADLPWEYGERMRPAAQPAIVYTLYKVWGVFGEVNPYHFAFFLRLLSAGGFVGLALVMHRRYATRMPTTRLVSWLALGLLFNWCSVYSGIRFSGENWSGMAIAAGFLLYPLGASSPGFTPSSGSVTPNHWAAFGAGLLFGLGFLFRYQVAILVVGFMAWLLLVGRERWRALALLVLGGLLMVGVGTLLDRWFYGEWVIAPWHYLRSNLIEGKAATFGTAPWWDYFRMTFERGVPPLSLLYIAAPLWFAWRYRRDPLTWMMVPFLLVHFLLSRKDARFLFPLLPYLPVMIMAGAVALRERFGAGFFNRSWVRRGLMFLWGVNLLILASVMVRPMISEVKVSKYVYDNYEEPVTVLADAKHTFFYADLTLRFYMRPGKVKLIEAPRTDWPERCPTPVCLYSQQTRVPTPPPGSRLVHTTRPRWLDDWGLKELLDGMSWWSVYEVDLGADAGAE